MRTKTVDPIQITYSKFSTEDLRNILNVTKEKGFRLLVELVKQKQEEKKDTVWSMRVDTEMMMLQMAEQKGFGIGLEWVIDIENQIREELDRRSEEKEKNLQSKS